MRNIIDDDVKQIHITNNDLHIDILSSISELSKNSSTGAAFYDEGPMDINHHINLDNLILNTTISVNYDDDDDDDKRKYRQCSNL